MAKKDFDEYYFTHYQGYLEALDALSQIGVESQNKMISQEHIDNAKASLQPIIDAQRFLDYVKYLLDKPTRKEKSNQYNKQNKKILDSEYNITNIKKSEQKIIDDFNKNRG